jgi:hypothetical protein
MKYLATLIILLFLISSNEILQAQWVQTNGLNEGQVNCLAVSGSNIFAGSDNGIYLSTNDGLNWTLILPTDSWVYVLIVNGTNIFAGTLGGGVYLSTNNGTNWTQKGMAGNDVFSLIVSGSNIFAGTLWGGVYLSTNNGTNWTQVNNGLTSSYVNYVASLAVSGTNIFAGTDCGIFLSTNNGTNWTQVGLAYTYVSSLTVNGTNIFAGTVNGVFCSTNNGTNWTQVDNGLTNNFVKALAISGTNIFAGTSANMTLGGSVFLSTNNGTNWTQVNNGLPSNTGVSSFAVNGTNIFTGISSGGVWRRPLSEFTDVAKEINDLPQEFTLSQNYPNPFNPSTVIKYAIPFESNINIRFYNSLGQCVREVDSGTRQAGYYEVNFSASGLASGVYFYSIKAISVDGKNNFSAVKKMIIIK